MIDCPTLLPCPRTALLMSVYTTDAPGIMLGHIATQNKIQKLEKGQSLLPRAYWMCSVCSKEWLLPWSLISWWPGAISINHNPAIGHVQDLNSRDLACRLALPLTQFVSSKTADSLNLCFFIKKEDRSWSIPRDCGKAGSLQGHCLQLSEPRALAVD